MRGIKTSVAFHAMDFVTAEPDCFKQEAGGTTRRREAIHGNTKNSNLRNAPNFSMATPWNTEYVGKNSSSTAPCAISYYDHCSWDTLLRELRRLNETNQEEVINLPAEWTRLSPDE